MKASESERQQIEWKNKKSNPDFLCERFSDLIIETQIAQSLNIIMMA